MKLICVRQREAYRSEDGSIKVIRMLRWNDKPAHWVVTWATIFGSTRREEFPTLKAVKKYLEGA